MNSTRSGSGVRLSDVAELAGVSMKTVSNVVRGYEHVSAATREKVQQAIAQLGYRPNLTARRLATGRTGMIALALPELDQPYFSEIARHIGRAANDRGYRIIVEQTLGDKAAESAVIRDREEGLVDGVIFHPARLDTIDIAKLRPETPLVLLGESARPIATDHVTIDNVQAARECVEYLLSTGKKKIAFLAAIAGDFTEATHLRLLGYQEALIHGGISPDPRLVFQSEGFGFSDGVRAVTNAIQAGVKFDAIMCRDDRFALAAIRALTDLDIRIPQDVAVIGWDNTALAETSTPALTSLAPDKEAIATLAVDLLCDRIDGELSIGRHRIVGHEISHRSTT